MATITQHFIYPGDTLIVNDVRITVAKTTEGHGFVVEVSPESKVTVTRALSEDKIQMAELEARVDATHMVA